jgi:hypothetical protein
MSNNNKKLSTENTAMNFDYELKGILDQSFKNFVGETKETLLANREAAKELLFLWAKSGKPEIKDNLEDAMTALIYTQARQIKSAAKKETRKIIKQKVQEWLIALLPIVIQFFKSIKLK